MEGVRSRAEAVIDPEWHALCAQHGTLWFMYKPRGDRPAGLKKTIDCAIEHAAACGHQVVACMERAPGHKVYGSFPSPEAFAAAGAAQGAHLYEVLPRDLPRHFYADLDWPAAALPDGPAVVRTFRAFVLDFAAEHAGHPVPSGAHVSSASGSSGWNGGGRKASYHLRFEFAFREQAPAKAFSQLLAKAIIEGADPLLTYSDGDETKSVFDTAPYGCNQLWRACYSSKFKADEEARPLIPCAGSSDDLRDHLVGIYDDGASTFLTCDAVAAPRTPHARTPRSLGETTADLEDDVHMLLGLLKPDRWSQYDSWRNIAFVLKRVGGDRLLGMFDKFSQKDAKYDHAALMALWRSIDADRAGSKLGIGSLRFWARTDDPVGYFAASWKDEPGLAAMEVAVERGGMDIDIAVVFQDVFESQYKWAATKNGGIFYKFTGNVWSNQEDEAGVFNIISDRVSMMFFKLARRYEDRLMAARGSDDDEYKAKLKTKIAVARNIVASLRKVSVVKKVIFAISNRLYDAEFLARLDTNLDLFAFKDGVYDLKTKEFRRGLPEDMLSVCAPYEYPATDPVRRAELEAFLRQIKPQNEEREYVLDQLGQCLSGRIRKQLIHVFSGPVAGNGKSTLIRLASLAFGGYFCTIPIAYVTQKSAQANAANPIILKLKCARLVAGQEPEERTRFNGALLKSLSGGDEQEGRLLFNNKLISYYPQFKLFFACNAMPDIDGSDQGVVRRIRKVEFGSQFVEGIGAPDLANHIYPINLDMDDSLKRWAPEFILMLLERYKIDYVYSCPLSIQQGTESYMQDNDVVKRFVAENLERDAEACVTLSELRFIWSCGEYEPMKLGDFKKGLVRVLATGCRENSSFRGVNRKNFFVGWKVVDSDAIEVVSE